MAKDVNNIIVTPARILYNTTTGQFNLPAPTLAVGGTWPAGWVEMGYTTQPLKMTYGFDVVEADIQESLAPVNAFKSKESLEFETSLAEFDIAQMQIAISAFTMVSGSQAAATYEQLNIGNYLNMPKYAFGFEGKMWKLGVALPIRIFVWKATLATGLALEFGKAKITDIPIKITALGDLSTTDNGQLYRIEKVTAQ